MNRIVDWIEQKLSEIWEWFIASILKNTKSEFSKSQIWFQRIWIFGLYLAGLGVWIVFLDRGHFQWGVQDWIWEWRYSGILKEAVTQWKIPLHTDPALSYGATRFLGIPDVPLTPQMLLLRFFDIGTNFLFNILIMFTLSYIGCLLLRRHYRLSIFSFTILTLLYNFNGFITSHIGVGHTLFAGYFLLPFFALLILQLIEGETRSDWFARMGMVLFGIELAGTTQLFAACLIFLCVLLLFTPKIRHHIIKAIIVGILLNIYRIAPASISVASHPVPAFAGFTTLADLLAGLIWVITPYKSVVGLPIGWWEFDMYVGLIGLAFLLTFGIYFVWMSTGNRNTTSRLRFLGLSMLIFSFLSIGYIYRPINVLPIPLLSQLHVPSRFFILPLLLTIALASARLQSWLDQHELTPWHHFLLVIMLAILGHDLIQHARIWRVQIVFDAFAAKALGPSHQIVSQADPLYTNVLVVSIIISLVTLGYLIAVLVKAGTKSHSKAINYSN